MMSVAPSHVEAASTLAVVASSNEPLLFLAADLKVIAASGLDDENRRTELAALGVGDVLMKPLHPAQLLGALRRQLSTGRTSTPWELQTGAAT